MKAVTASLRSGNYQPLNHVFGICRAHSIHITLCPHCGGLKPSTHRKTITVTPGTPHSTRDGWSCESD